MGREIKRVPLSWEWPLEKIWEGFVSPEWRKCPNQCENGSTTLGKWVASIIYPLLMLDEAYKTGKLHPWLREIPLSPQRLREGANYRDIDAFEPLPISSDVIEFCRALAGRESGSMGHDALDQWHAKKALLRGVGLSEDFFVCKTCQGSSIHPDDVADSEAWERTEPPTGEGWQVWETVSEGSPITPVCPTAEDLIDYLAAKGTTWDQKPNTFGARDRGPWRRTAAEIFVKNGWAPSGVGISGVGFFDGGRDADLIAKAGEK